MRAIGVTGASGYIGQAVVRKAKAAGWRVVALGRRPADLADDFRPADLSNVFNKDVIRDLDAVLHLAADVTGSALAPGQEVAFATDLAEACRARAVPLLVVSSQAASANAPSAYGRTKAAIEQCVLARGAIVVRPGLVVGGREAGLFGQLVGLTRALPILPFLIPRPWVQPVHVGDLAAALVSAVHKRELAGECLSVAGPRIHFDELLMQIAHHRLGRGRVRMPIPTSLLRLLLAGANRLLGPAFSPSRLDSLTTLPSLDSAEDLRKLGITLRPLSQALDRRGSIRRVLMREAGVLTRAATGWRAKGSLMRRYSRLLARLGVVNPLSVPCSLQMCPITLGSLDSAARRRHSVMGDLSWRMDLASRLAETEPTWAAAYIVRPGASGRLRALGDFLIAGLREVLVRLVAPWARFVERNRL